MKPFFSIVIPTLNEEKFLPKLLESLGKQTFKNFEVIVVDGKSEDQTVAVAREFLDKANRINKTNRMKILTSSKRNVGYQRNLGARQAKGDYLVFFDADVTVEQNFLKKVYQHIKKEESLLMTTWLLPDSHETIDELFVLLTNYAIELARYTKKAILPGFNIVVERNTFWAIGGFDERIKHAEDIDFAQKARKKGLSPRFLKEPLLTISLRRFRREGRIEVLRKYSKSLTYLLFKGPITRDLFDYPMGGEYHLEKKKTHPFKTLKKKWHPFFQLLFPR